MPDARVARLSLTDPGLLTSIQMNLPVPVLAASTFTAHLQSGTVAGGESEDADQARGKHVHSLAAEVHAHVAADLPRTRHLDRNEDAVDAADAMRERLSAAGRRSRALRRVLVVAL